MREFSADTSALSLNTATLGHNLDGHGAGWPIERVIDACAKHGFGGITFWRREIGDRAIEIGNRVRAAGMEVTGLCRTPYLVGSERPANWLDEAKASIDMTADLGATVLTIVSGGTEPGTKGVLETQKILAERLSQITDYAATRDVLLALEPLNPMFGGNRTCIMTVRDALSVCTMVGAALLGKHGTRGQAEFFLSTRGQNIKGLENRDALQSRTLAAAKEAVPADWSFVQVVREDLNRFLFSANDIIVAIGQDGLVANLAKYLDGQPVIGVTPDPASSEGVLTRHGVDVLPALLKGAAHADVDIQARTMVQAQAGEGLSLFALNELFIGHRSHQSARYVLQAGGSEEFQSSSGLIVATGTGLTGWAKSIMTATHQAFDISPEENRAAFFAREPWPSRTSGCDIAAGEIAPDSGIAVVSRINEGGVIFADGIEQDFLAFDWGVEAQVRLADKRLSLVV